MGTVAHLADVVEQGHADAAAIADVLHWDRFTLEEIRSEADRSGIPVRRLAWAA
jgi:cyclase